MTRSQITAHRESPAQEPLSADTAAPSKYEAAVQRIVADSRDNPVKYLQETVVPDGGE